MLFTGVGRGEIYLPDIIWDQGLKSERGDFDNYGVIFLGV